MSEGGSVDELFQAAGQYEEDPAKHRSDRGQVRVTGDPYVPGQICLNPLLLIID